MARDDDGDIIEIDFDDDENELGDTATVQDARPVIEVVLDDDTPLSAARAPSSPTRPPTPRRRSTPAPRTATGPNADPPDAGGKPCPVCGFAIPPLEAQCPRCARSGPPAAAAGGSTQLPAVDPSVAYPDVAPPRRRTGAVIGVIVVLMVIVGAAALAAYLIINSPHQRARRAFDDGLKAQLAGDMDTARQKYQEALELDPDMGLAALMMGMTHLGISLTGNTTGYLQQLMELAAGGDTRTLSEADRWFDHAILIADRLPPTSSLRHADIKTPAQLAAYAHVMKAITAYLRYSAGLMSEDPLSASPWLSVMQSELQQAFALDPTNPYARDMQNQLPPL